MGWGVKDHVRQRIDLGRGRLKRIVASVTLGIGNGPAAGTSRGRQVRVNAVGAQADADRILDGTKDVA